MEEGKQENQDILESVAMAPHHPDLPSSGALQA